MRDPGIYGGEESAANARVMGDSDTMTRLLQIPVGLKSGYEGNELGR